MLLISNKISINKNKQIYFFLFFLYFSLLIFYTSPRQWGLMGYLLFAKVELKRHTTPISQINKKIRLEAYTEQSFYQMWPNIFHALSGKSKVVIDENIFQSLTGKSPIRLSWTHYSITLQVEDTEARSWYEHEAATEMWSTRTLQRNVSSQYYKRLLKSQNKPAVHDEMVALTKPLQDKLEYLKNPVIAEFLGFKNNTDYTESDLEQSIIDHLIPFLMELGKGFAFVDRQKRIHTEKEDYYIDLVFYNYHLRCFVLIDLKTNKLSYQDVGQMDMYVKMYDELVRPEGHNPTIGILLCADTDNDVAHYSTLSTSDQLYAAKYLTYMPTQEELRREIEQQKAFFWLQNGQNGVNK